MYKSDNQMFKVRRYLTEKEEKIKQTLDLYLKQLITWNNERRKREKDSFIFYKYEFKKKQKPKI